MELGEIKIDHEDYDRIVEEGRCVADSDEHIYFQIGIMTRINGHSIIDGYSTMEGCIRQTLGIPIMQKKRVEYSKIESSPDIPSSHVGKWRIHFEDGKPILPEAFPEEAWPSYPLVVSDEEEAVIFTKSWEDYLHACS